MSADAPVVVINDASSGFDTSRTTPEAAAALVLGAVRERSPRAVGAAG